MIITKDCINMIKQFEGCRLEAYKDVVGVWTIGYGSTNAIGINVVPGMKITQAQAEQFLMIALEKQYLPKVMKYDSIYHWSVGEANALVSFAYNIGSIDQLCDKGRRAKSVIADKILAYNKAGGKVLSGLTRRREAERRMFLSDGQAQSSHAVLETLLKKGSKGEDVKWLQRALNEHGANLKVDGVFGENTDRALRIFQENNRLSVDGICGSKTRAMLLSY